MTVYHPNRTTAQGYHYVMITGQYGWSYVITEKFSLWFDALDFANEIEEQRYERLLFRTVRELNTTN